MPVSHLPFSSSPAETLIHICSPFLESFSLKAGKNIFSQALSHLKPLRFLLAWHGQPFWHGIQVSSFVATFECCVVVFSMRTGCVVICEARCRMKTQAFVQQVVRISRWWQHCSQKHDVRPSDLSWYCIYFCCFHLMGTAISFSRMTMLLLKDGPQKQTPWPQSI